MINKEERAKIERNNWTKYKTPGCSNLHRRKVNAIFLNPVNSWEHECEKCRVAYSIQEVGHKFITEAERCRKEKGKSVRVDVVNITLGQEYEIVYKHEDDADVKEYRRKGIIPIIVNPYTCKICNEKYPIKTKKKKEICKNCAKNHKNID